MSDCPKLVRPALLAFCLYAGSMTPVAPPRDAPWRAAPVFDVAPAPGPASEDHATRLFRILGDEQRMSWFVAYQRSRLLAAR